MLYASTGIPTFCLFFIHPTMASAPFFTPVQTALGGVLLHLSTSNLLRDVGTVFGVSGIVYGSVFGDRAKWRWAILGGMVTTAAALQAEPLRYLVTGSPIAAWERLGGVLGRVATAGFLVGLGSKVRVMVCLLRRADVAAGIRLYQVCLPAVLPNITVVTFYAAHHDYQSDQ